MWNHDRAVIDDFLAEVGEHVGAIERGLLELEDKPEKATIAAIFRAAHSIKGTVGLFGYPRALALAHAMEGVLGRMRTGDLAPSQEAVSALLAANALLLSLLDPSGGEASEEELAALAGLRVFERAGREGAAQVHFASSSVRSAVPSTTVRVPLARLDELGALVGELDQVATALAERAGDPEEVRAQAERARQLAERLRRGLSSMRVLPVGDVFGRFRRMVRELAIALRKEVELELIGADLEIEKSVLDALVDPVGHLVRNAVDHGLEHGEARVEVGKAARGLVQLKASFDERGLVIEVSDDGRGIDPRAVARAAVERGLVAEPRVHEASDAELLALIFEPGLTTAAEVTDVSGRGVGMDVVRECVERLGGTIDVRSRLGGGTTIALAVPLRRPTHFP